MTANPLMLTKRSTVMHRDRNQYDCWGARGMSRTVNPGVLLSSFRWQLSRPANRAFVTGGNWRESPHSMATKQNLTAEHAWSGQVCQAWAVSLSASRASSSTAAQQMLNLQGGPASRHGAGNPCTETRNNQSMGCGQQSRGTRNEMNRQTQAEPRPLHKDFLLPAVANVKACAGNKWDTR